MNVLDLFSGIGGFSLGLERAGMRTVAFCEIEPFARAVLAKHWPDVPCYDDVRTLTAARLSADGIAADVICGGFPCQDISYAGKGAGIEGSRSGLWSEYARIIGELRPRFVVVENVSALLSRGLDVVLGDLAALGYDAEWHCIRAADAGAPHLRDRVWIIAQPQHPHADLERLHRTPLHIDGSLEFQDEQVGLSGSFRKNVAHPDKSRLEGWIRRGLQECAGERLAWASGSLGDADSEGQLQPQGSEREEWRRPTNPGWWLVEPDVGRVAHGVPARMDRLKALGNAVVPQVTEIIGRAIMRASELSSQDRG